MRFITEDNQNVNLINHTLEMIKLNPSLIIRIGTDSQNFSDKTKFVTSVVYRWSGRKGAHYIFIKENINIDIQEKSKDIDNISFNLDNIVL